MSNPYETTHAGLLDRMATWWKTVGNKRGKLMIAPDTNETGILGPDLTHKQVTKLMEAAAES